VDAGLVHMVGSDAHTAGIREVGLSGARKVIGDQELARWLTESVPAAIVHDEVLPARPTLRRPPGLLARLFGR
jgi:tyrosine-protein phosphatase YwqE